MSTDHTSKESPDTGLAWYFGPEIMSTTTPVFHYCAIDAIFHAEGPIAHRIEYRDHGGRVLWFADATRTLHEFSVWCSEKSLEPYELSPEVSVFVQMSGKHMAEGEASRVFQEGLDDAWSDAARHAAWMACWGEPYMQRPVTGRVIQKLARFLVEDDQNTELERRLLELK